MTKETASLRVRNLQSTEAGYEQPIDWGIMYLTERNEDPTGSALAWCWPRRKGRIQWAVASVIGANVSCSVLGQLHGGEHVRRQFR